MFSDFQKKRGERQGRGTFSGEDCLQVDEEDKRMGKGQVAAGVARDGGKVLKKGCLWSRGGRNDERGSEEPARSVSLVHLLSGI